MITVPYFEGATGSVYYKAWRVPAPRTAAVVFLHGFGEHSGLYHRLGNSLNASGIELWALDEIGHGLTQGERAVIPSIDDLVENGRRLAALAEEADPESPLFLAGHSLGGVVAAVSASRDSVAFEGLILSGAPLSPLDWVVTLQEEGPAAELALDLADLSADPFYLDELENDPLAFTSAAGAQSLVGILPPAWDELDGTFDRVALPVLFLHGTDDPIAPVEATRSWADRVPDGRIAEFGGAHHDVLNETVHRQVAAELVDFVVRTSEPVGTFSRGEHVERTARNDLATAH
jgi:alpha-beta hydrolase superfamily lysophospholipase